MLQLGFSLWSIMCKHLHFIIIASDVYCLRTATRVPFEHDSVRYFCKRTFNVLFFFSIHFLVCIFSKTRQDGLNQVDRLLTLYLHKTMFSDFIFAPLIK